MNSPEPINPFQAAPIAADLAKPTSSENPFGDENAASLTQEGAGLPWEISGGPIHWIATARLCLFCPTIAYRKHNRQTPLWWLLLFYMIGFATEYLGYSAFIKVSVFVSRAQSQPIDWNLILIFVVTDTLNYALDFFAIMGLASVFSTIAAGVMHLSLRLFRVDTSSFWTTLRLVYLDSGCHYIVRLADRLTVGMGTTFARSLGASSSLMYVLFFAISIGVQVWQLSRLARGASVLHQAPVWRCALAIGCVQIPFVLLVLVLQYFFDSIR